MKNALIAVAGLIVLLAVTLFAVGKLRPDLAYAAVMDLERSLAGLESRSITVDGLEWRYLEGSPEGRPDAPTLVLVHGFGADKDNWVRVGKHLKDDFRLVVPDLIGFGESDRPADLDYRIRAQADRLIAFLDAIGVERSTIGGSSMGGYIAGAVANSDPQRVEALWLVAPGGVVSGEPSEMFERILGGQSNPLVPESFDDFAFTMDFLFTEQPFVSPSVLAYLAERQIQRRPLLERIFEDLRYNSRPLEEYLDGHGGAALIVWGSRDRVLHPSGARVLEAIMPAARVQIIEGAGHLPMIERPQEVARGLLGFRAALPAQG